MRLYAVIAAVTWSGTWVWLAVRRPQLKGRAAILSLTVGFPIACYGVRPVRDLVTLGPMVAIPFVSFAAYWLWLTGRVRHAHAEDNRHAAVSSSEPFSLDPFVRLPGWRKAVGVASLATATTLAISVATLETLSWGWVALVFFFVSVSLGSFLA